MKVKAISLWEPWASLMRIGAKTIETRSWYTSYRGPLLICAAKRWSREQFDMFYSDPVIRPMRDAVGALSIDKLLFGKAVCLVSLVNCMMTTSLFPSPRERAFGDFAPGRFGWITTNRRVFDPFPVTGRQGLFEVELPSGVNP